MSSPASSQMLKESEHAVANAQDTPSDALGAALSPTRSKVANTEVTLHTKPQAANVKVAQERGLRFWLILVALGSALCLVSIELVRLAKHSPLVGLNRTFTDGNIDSPASYHKSSSCGHFHLDIFFVCTRVYGCVTFKWWHI
jgi:hypothetical protein